MIGVIDYGSGNISAIQNIYKRLRIETRVVSSPEELATVSKIILPGVGAFDEAMSKLNASSMRDALDECVLVQKKPVLGVCVGMQIMASSSEEGSLEGLGWIPGRVRRFDEKKIDQLPKVPHMGWNCILPNDSSIFRGIDADVGFYFLHSYYFEAENREDVLAKATYGGEFDCAVNRGQIFGFQFHPEKSHSNGIQLFKNFSEIS